MTLTEALHALHRAGRIRSPAVEDWALVTNWPGYAASRHGEVASLPRIVHRRHTGWYSVGARVLTNIRHRRGGYLMVALTVQDKTTKVFVHRLVLDAFVGRCPEGQQCRHLDGDPTNNHLSNLAWGTAAENATDRDIHGRLTRDVDGRWARVTT
jgi:hypothetical protein